jgi:Family of unknown function (DUF6600)
MLPPMNRLLRLLVSGGCIATSSFISLMAGAMPPSPPTGVPQVPIPADAPPAATASAGSSDKAAGPLPALPSSAPQAQGAQAAPSAEPTDPAAYDASADTDPAALDDFRDTLAPYGSWEDDATYGVVWVPSAGVVGAEFTPYVSHGHWALADDGNWMWVSDFNWGWAPFHYGRWLWISGRGWAWIPGRVYSNAWVVWRTGYYDDYYVGWAPMPPTWYWRSGFAYGLYYVPPAPYVFCSSRYVFYPHVHSYIVPASRVGVIAPRTQPYVAAAGTVGPTTYHAAALTRGPTMGDAHIPAGNVPSQRVAPDRRLDYSRTTVPRAYPASQPVAPRDAYRPPSSPQAAPNVYTRPSSPQTYGRPSAPPSVYYNRPAPAEIPRPTSPSPPTVRPSVPYNVPRSDARTFTPPAPRPAPVTPAPAPAAPFRPQTAPLRKVPARR